MVGRENIALIIKWLRHPSFVRTLTHVYTDSIAHAQCPYMASLSAVLEHCGLRCTSEVNLRQLLVAV